MKQSQAGTLIVCVLGLYGSFISWSILQEKINTKPYGNEFFKAPLVVNIIQSLFAVIISFLYSQTATRTSPFTIFTHNESAISKMYFQKFVIISLTASFSAPIGYKSLKHVDYLIYLLSKSCKLIPVMIVHILFYQTKFPAYKYMVAVLVTGGVILFTLANTSSSKSSSHDGNTLLGVSQLFTSMILDGLTNSTQDQLFKIQKLAPQIVYKLNGISLMCILNTFMGLLTLAYTLVFKYDEEVIYTINFIHQNPQVLRDIVAFGLFGSVGQIFVFIILEKFDSIVLTTATVTRKMLSMVLSVVLFGHQLNIQQVGGILLVFAGIGYEALIKIVPNNSNPSSNPKPKPDSKEKKNV